MLQRAQVDVVRVVTGQGESGDAVGRWRPDQRLIVDAGGDE